LVEKEGNVASGKSIMGLIMLSAGPGVRLRIRARGSDASEAIQALAALVSSNFDEH
jgi:phosphocarrier protein